MAATATATETAMEEETSKGTESEAAPVSDRIQKALENIEAEKTLITACADLWRRLSDRISSLDRSISDRSKSLDATLESYETRCFDSLARLDALDASLPSRESAAAASVESLRRSALDEIESSGATPPTELVALLRWYARLMHGVALWRLMVLHRKDLIVIRGEIADALHASVDPHRLVLDAVEDFVNMDDVGGDRCWAVGMLMKVLYDLEDGRRPVVATSISDRAMVVAEAWKAKAGGDKMGGTEAQVLLQIVLAFGLQSRFDIKFLKKLPLQFPSRKEMPKLANGLCSEEEMGDLIAELIKNGRELEAVSFACESGLTERFSPAALIESHLQNAKEKAAAIVKKGNGSKPARESANILELSALKATVRYVEAYKLESSCSLEGPKKRIAELEKAKADNKKIPSKSNAKRSRERTRGNGSAPSRPPKSVRMSSGSYPSLRRGPPHAYQASVSRHSYAHPGQGALDSSVPPPLYAGPAHIRNPVPVPQQYYATADLAGPRSAMPYSSAPYGDYVTSHAAAVQQPSYPPKII